MEANERTKPVQCEFFQSGFLFNDPCRPQMTRNDLENSFKAN